MDIDSSLYNYLTELRESSKIMIRKGFMNNRMLPKHHLLWEHFGFCFMGTESGIGTHWILEGYRRDKSGQNPVGLFLETWLLALCERKGVFFILGLGKLIGRFASRILGLDRITKGSVVLGHFPIPHLRLHLNYPRWIRMNTAYNLLVKYFWEIPYFHILSWQFRIKYILQWVLIFMYLFFAFFLPLKVLNTLREGKAYIHLCIPSKPSTEWPWGPVCWAELYCSVLTRTRKHADHCSLPVLHGVFAKLKTNTAVIWLASSLLVLPPVETDQHGGRNCQDWSPCFCSRNALWWLGLGSPPLLIKWDQPLKEISFSRLWETGSSTEKQCPRREAGEWARGQAQLVPGPGPFPWSPILPSPLPDPSLLSLGPGKWGWKRL